MKKNFLLLFILLCISFLASAQEAKTWEQKRQQFKAEKIAFISTEMNFSVEEAQQFWPIYNTFDEQLDKIGDKRRAIFDPHNVDVNSLNETQCKNVMDSFFELDKKELEIKQNFYNQLKEKFTYTQIMKYYHAEHEFRRKIFCKPKYNDSFGKSYKNE